MDSLKTTLRSFVNNYQAVMWRLRECPLNDEQLATAIGISSTTIRSRRSKPDLWKLSDIERLGIFFGVPTSACVQLNAILHELPDRWAALPASERRKAERLLPVKRVQVVRYNQTDWPVRHLLTMYQNLTTRNV